MFLDRYNELCVKKGESANAVAKKLGIASGTVSEWKNGRAPRNSTAIKIADYFDVPVDYLLGKTDDPGKKEKPDAISDELWNKIENDPKALKLLELLLNMSPEQRDKFEKILEEI
jgi:transcriptional regulator with XRE-family HTH domain